MNDIFKINIKALRKRNPELADEVVAAKEAPIEVGTAKSGEKYFKYKGIHFHSAYYPHVEAERSVARVLVQERDWVLLFGLGFGYLSRLILKEEKTSVTVYEPDVALLKSILQQLDLSELLSNKSFVLTTDLGQIKDEVMEKSDGVLEIVQFLTIPYKIAYLEKVKDFALEVDKSFTRRKLLINTMTLSSKVWLENYLKNIPVLLDCPTLDILKDKFEGIPAIIVGAGPSLKKNVHHLKKVKGKVLIIAALSAFHPLLKFGVIPDFVIAAEKVALPTFFPDRPETAEVRLMLADVSHPDFYLPRNTLKTYTFFNHYNAFAPQHMSMWGSEYRPVSGGNVTTTAYDIALFAGSSPLVFIGQDFAYGENESHVDGSPYGKQELEFDKGNILIKEHLVEGQENSRSHEVVMIKDKDGKLIPSSRSWVAIHDWLVSYIATAKEEHPEAVFINASEQGAYVDGMVHMPLSEVLEKYCDLTDDSQPAFKAIEEAESSVEPVDIAALKKSLLSNLSAVRGVLSRTKSITTLAKELEKKIEAKGISPELEGALKKLANHEKKLFKHSEDAIFIWDALFELSHQVDKIQKHEKVDEDVTAQSLKDIKQVGQMYKIVGDNCKDFIVPLEDAIKALEARSIDL